MLHTYIHRTTLNPTKRRNSGLSVLYIMSPCLIQVCLKGNYFDKYGGASNLAELNAMLKNR